MQYRVLSRVREHRPAAFIEHTVVTGTLDNWSQVTPMPPHVMVSHRLAPGWATGLPPSAQPAHKTRQPEGPRHRIEGPAEALSTPWDGTRSGHPSRGQLSRTSYGESALLERRRVRLTPWRWPTGGRERSTGSCHGALVLEPPCLASLLTASPAAAHSNTHMHLALFQPHRPTARRASGDPDVNSGHRLPPAGARAGHWLVSRRAAREQHQPNKGALMKVRGRDPVRPSCKGTAIPSITR